MNRYKHFLPVLVLVSISYVLFFFIHNQSENPTDTLEAKPKVIFERSKEAGIIKGALLNERLYLDKNLPKRPKPKRIKKRTAKVKKAPLPAKKIKRVVKFSPKTPVNNSSAQH